MGDILSFIAKVRSAGDWTDGERARLQELAERFGGNGGGVEVVFGATERGDPWCVVKDAHEEVLVHVARIDGQFIVHYAVEDALTQGADLHVALGERLDRAEAMVIPFAGRQAQTFLALIVATAFYYETSHLPPLTAEPAHGPQPDDAPALPAAAVIPDDLSLTQKREVVAPASLAANAEDPGQPAAQASSTAGEEPAPAAAHTASAPLAAPPPSAKPAPAPAAAEHPAAPAPTVVAEAHVIHGTAGDDRMVGTPGSDRLIGGAGNDTLSGGGAGHGGVDILQGGPGADRLQLGPQVVAEGGSGADTFVVEAPHVMDQAATFLGAISDFHAAEGDRLVTATGRPVTIVLTQPVQPQSFATHTPPTTLQTQPGVEPGVEQRVEVDLDGDGHPDGYVLLVTTIDQGVEAVHHDEGVDIHTTALPLAGTGFTYEMIG